jgi:HPt (histidine-containing phosphotransfer) domain-containing protein
MRSPAATKLLPRFLEHRERDVVSLRAAVEREDFETIARIGHNMRGNGQSYGFPDLGTIGECLEAAADAKSTVGVLEHLRSLVAWLAQATATARSEDSRPRLTSSTRVRAIKPGVDPEGTGGGGEL